MRKGNLLQDLTKRVRRIEVSACKRTSNKVIRGKQFDRLVTSRQQPICLALGVCAGGLGWVSDANDALSVAGRTTVGANVARVFCLES